MKISRHFPKGVPRPRSKVYGTTVTLAAEIKAVECWNMTDGTKGNLKAGLSVKICHPYDATHATVETAGVMVRPALIGYRFIVPNRMLRKAGIMVPLRTRDIVGEIIDRES